MARINNNGFKLSELIRAANRRYRGKHLSAYFDQQHEAIVSGSGDTLAEFIVRELNDTFEARAPKESQLHSAVLALERAKSDLQDAINGLTELDHR